MLQLVFRFVVGGAIVTLFAALGDVLKPKSFVGLFGAAPSVAMATLGLTIFVFPLVVRFCQRSNYGRFPLSSSIDSNSLPCRVCLATYRP